MKPHREQSRYRLTPTAYARCVQVGLKMDYIAFPLRIEKNGQLARASGVEENLLSLLRLMLTTPAAGWAGSPNFGMRDALAELSFKSNLRLEIVRRLNENLHELGIDWVKVKTIQIESAKDSYEPSYLLLVEYKNKGIETLRI